MARSKAVCECAGCGRKFSTEKKFDKHRTGSFGEPVYGGGKSRIAKYYTKHQRRCMSEDEMRDVGLYPNSDGIWTTSILDTDEVSEEKEEVQT